MDTTTMPGAATPGILMTQKKPKGATAEGGATGAAVREEARPDPSGPRTDQTPRRRHPVVPPPAGRFLAAATPLRRRRWKPSQPPPRP
jgi:hypothetical protein